MPSLDPIVPRPSPERLMPRRSTKSIILILIPLILLAGLSVGWWWMAIGRHPLRGDLSHDFGTMPIVGDDVSRSHTFRLRNVTGETIAINAIRPGCGCTAIAADRDVVPPGEFVEIETTLTLNRSGVKHAQIDLILGDHGMQTLWVHGKGVRDLRLTTNTTSLRLRPGEEETLILLADVLGVGEPPDLSFDAPPGVTATLHGWSQIDEGERASARPDVWRGRVTVELDQGAALPEDAALAVLAKGDAALTIPLRFAGRPGDADDDGDEQAEDERPSRPTGPAPGFGPGGP